MFALTADNTLNSSLSVLCTECSNDDQDQESITGGITLMEQNTN